MLYIVHIVLGLKNDCKMMELDTADHFLKPGFNRIRILMKANNNAPICLQFNSRSCNMNETVKLLFYNF